MTNKKVTVLFIIFVIATVGVVFIITNLNQPPKQRTFLLSDYVYYIENFSSKETVGSIKSAEDAVQKAESVWLKLYGESVKKQKPYQVFYDAQSGVWLIQGTFKRYLLSKKGGVAKILIKHSTGEVLAVWHEK